MVTVLQVAVWALSLRTFVVAEAVSVNIDLVLAIRLSSQSAAVTRVSAVMVGEQLGAPWGTCLVTVIVWLTLEARVQVMVSRRSRLTCVLGLAVSKCRTRGLTRLKSRNRAVNGISSNFPVLTWPRGTRCLTVVPVLRLQLPLAARYSIQMVLSPLSRAAV